MGNCQSSKEKASDTSVKSISNRTESTRNMGPNILVVTDIGVDYDDFMALLILGHHHKAGRIRLRGVITTLHPAERRARLAKGLLNHMGIDDVEVAVGSEGTKAIKPLEPYEDAALSAKFCAKDGTTFRSHLELAKDIFADLKEKKEKLRLLSIASLHDTWEIYEQDKDSFVHLVDQIHAQGGCQLGSVDEADITGHKHTETQATSNFDRLKAEADDRDDKVSRPVTRSKTAPTRQSAQTSTSPQSKAATPGRQIAGRAASKMKPSIVKELLGKTDKAMPMKNTADDAHVLRPRTNAKNNDDDLSAAKNIYALVQRNNINCVAYNKEAAAKSLFPVAIFDNNYSKCIGEQGLQSYKDRPKHMKEVADYLFKIHSMQKMKFYIDSLKPETRFREHMDRDWYIAHNTLSLPAELARNPDCKPEDVMPYSLVTPYDPIAALGCIGDEVGEPVLNCALPVKGMPKTAEQRQVKWDVDGVEIAQAIERNLNDALMTG